MNSLTQPLRDEHKHLFPHVERIREVAELVGKTDIRLGLDEVYDFLAFHLKPHAEAEEMALYPVVQKALGSPDATRTMSRDHVEIGRYITELDSLQQNFTEELTEDLRRVLYGVYGLVKVHFAKEEEIYLPILDSYLTPESANELFESMEAAAHTAKSADRF